MKRKKDPLGLESFESAFFKDPVRIRKVASSKTTWTGAYLPYLRRLTEVASSNSLPLGSTLFEQTLETYAVSSRSRQQCGVALAALAKHHKLQLPDDWTARAAGYGLHEAKFRRLPSDEQILKAVELIPNPAWKLVYGLMATYGLRNHEVFFCDLSTLAEGGDRVIRVLPSTKTGEHQVWAFKPEWVDHFGLEVLGEFNPPLPDVCTDLSKTTLQAVGRRVSEQFKRYGVPFTPYDLRHAWAVRTIHMGLPDTVAARMMGHSVSMHTRTYHHWITRRDQQQAVDTALAKLTPVSI
jgi:integrase